MWDAEKTAIAADVPGFEAPGFDPSAGAVRSETTVEELEAHVAELAARVAALEERSAGAVRSDARGEIAELRLLVENTIAALAKGVGVVVPRT